MLVCYIYLINHFLNFCDGMGENAVGTENTLMALQKIQIAKLVFGFLHILEYL